MKRKLYPMNWEELALAIKEEASGVCQECKKQCRKPGERLDSHRRTLTVAHSDHVPQNCERENLKALCAPSHLRYDAPHKAKNRVRKRREAARRESC